MRDHSGDPAGARADYDAAVALMEELRRRLGTDWPPDWADLLASAYLDRGILLEDTSHLEKAIADWDRATQIYRSLVERGPLGAGSQLLEAVSWQLGGCRDLNDWPKAARCLRQFLAFHHGLQKAWMAQEGEGEPPWQAITAQFARMVHGLDPEQHAALLDALGDDAEWVKEVFGWT